MKPSADSGLRQVHRLLAFATRSPIRAEPTAVVPSDSHYAFVIVRFGDGYRRAAPFSDRVIWVLSLESRDRMDLAADQAVVVRATLHLRWGLEARAVLVRNDG